MSSPGFRDFFASAKGAVLDSYVEQMYARVLAGKRIPLSEMKGTLEAKIQAAASAGAITSEDDIRAIVYQHFNPAAAIEAPPAPENTTVADEGSAAHPSADLPDISPGADEADDPLAHFPLPVDTALTEPEPPEVIPDLPVEPPPATAPVPSPPAEPAPAGEASAALDHLPDPEEVIEEPGFIDRFADSFEDLFARVFGDPVGYIDDLFDNLSRGRLVEEEPQEYATEDATRLLGMMEALRARERAAQPHTPDLPVLEEVPEAHWANTFNELPAEPAPLAIPLEAPEYPVADVSEGEAFAPDVSLGSWQGTGSPEDPWKWIDALAATEATAEAVEGPEEPYRTLAGQVVRQDPRLPAGVFIPGVPTEEEAEATVWETLDAAAAQEESSTEPEALADLREEETEEAEEWEALEAETGAEAPLPRRARARGLAEDLEELEVGEGAPVGGGEALLGRVVELLERSVELLEQLSEQQESRLPAPGQGNIPGSGIPFSELEDEADVASPSIDVGGLFRPSQRRQRHEEEEI